VKEEGEPVEIFGYKEVEGAEGAGVDGRDTLIEAKSPRQG
jgi:hypothetical protein